MDDFDFFVQMGLMGQPHHFSWLNFEDLKETYFYPEFIKTEIHHLPDSLEIRIDKNTNIN